MIKLKEIITQPITGKPFSKIVYRGDDTEFSQFDPSFIGKSTGTNTQGFWFTSSQEAAEFYGQYVRKFEISMNNPLVFTSEDFSNMFPSGPTKFAKIAKSKGHDGVVILDIIDGDRYSDVYCVWTASQIKQLT